MRDGVTRIAKERVRQQEEKQWTREHDLQYINEEMRRAAAVYALPEDLREIEVVVSRRESKDGVHVFTSTLKTHLWPWKKSWYKPNKEHPERDIEKAGALLAAELDRRQETVRCAAIWVHTDRKYSEQPKNVDKGIVFTGHRHSNAIAAADHSNFDLTKQKFTQGFLTSGNRFVDRKEAADIAYKAGQIYTPVGTLHSEDLY